jgi:subtilisin family serine protease
MGTSAGGPFETWTTPVIALSAILKAASLGADIVNISWFIEPNKPISDAIADAAQHGRSGKGIVFVCASGDDGGLAVFPSSLAGPPNNLPIITVGSINSWNQVKTHSSSDLENWASNTGPAISVVAPGVGIATTTLNAGGQTDGSYVFDFDGTSSSAPFVSGVAALVLSANPQLTSSQVRDVIEQTAERDGAASRNDNSGWGRVNACRALRAPNC